MKGNDFDHVPDRRGTASVKWDRYGGRDVLPLWVADMDFPAPAPVIEALANRVRHGVFGYTHVSESLVEAVLAHVDEHYAWTIEREWLVWLPGAVPALNAACRLIARENAVVTTTPIYPPFLAAPVNMGRQLSEVPFDTESERAVLDLDRLERSFADRGKLFLFCNPHNPLGRVFTEPELVALAERALRHDVLIVSDEVHADLVLEPGLQHRPLAAVAPELAARTITLLSPSKTFNLAGLGFAYAVIPDAQLRRRFRSAIDGILPYVNALAYAAAEAAYTDGWNWHAALIRYLRANRDRVTEALAALPAVGAAPPEGTYLYWMDLRDSGIEEPVRHFVRHGVGLSDGADFGAPGFARLNFACPRATLDVALGRIAAALRTGEG
ncbi:MAG: MalY/PatB family protein [Gammaproteobacteria bacterium]